MTRGRPRPSLRWNRLFADGGRVLECCVRDSGSCVGCGLSTSWTWWGTCREWIEAINVRARSVGVALGRILGVHGVGRDGRVTCHACRTRAPVAHAT